MNRDIEKRLRRLETKMAPVEVEALLFCEPTDAKPIEGDMSDWLADGRARLTANGRVCVYGNRDPLPVSEWEERYCE